MATGICCKMWFDVTTW